MVFRLYLFWGLTYCISWVGRWYSCILLFFFSVFVVAVFGYSFHFLENCILSLILLSVDNSSLFYLFFSCIPEEKNFRFDSWLNSCSLLMLCFFNWIQVEPIFEKGVDQQSTDEARILLVCCTVSVRFWLFEFYYIFSGIDTWCCFVGPHFGCFRWEIQYLQTDNTTGYLW